MKPITGVPAVFDIKDHEDHICRSKERISIAQSFCEPDRVPVVMDIGGSYYCGLFGYNIRDYYQNPELQVEVQLKGLNWRFNCLRDDFTWPSIGYEAGPVGEGVLFDCPIEYHDNTSPRVVPILKTVEDIDRFQVPEINSDHPRISGHMEHVHRFVNAAKKTGMNVPISEIPHVPMHPPLSAACAMMDPVEVFTLMYTDPAALHRFLQKMLDAFFRLREFMDKQATPSGNIGLADDNSCAIGPEQYREFVLPYNRQIYERYGWEHRRLHTDGPSEQHFDVYTSELKLNAMDIGGFSDLTEAVRIMKGKVYIHGGLCCQDFYQPGPMSEATRKKARSAMKLAGPGGGFELAIGGECYVGVSPQGICDLVRFVEKEGTYPLN